MDTLTVLFPVDEAGAAPIAEFADDFKAADLFPVFEPLLFDLNRAINSRELVLYGTRRDQHAPMMYRGPRLQAEQYRKLYQLVEGRHWRMITDHYVYEFDHYHRNAPYVHVVNEPYLAIPEMAIGGISQYAIDRKFPHGFALKDLDAQSSRFLERVGTPIEDQWYRDIVAQRDHARFGGYADNLVAQEWVNLKRYADATNEWRVRYFDGQVVDVQPNSGQPESCPRPPEELIAKYRSNSAYFTLDIVELEDGTWLYSGLEDGQVCPKALHQSYEDYWRSLARVVEGAPHLPEWVWCLTANVVDEHEVGDDKHVERGTKQFRPGAKVYVAHEWHCSTKDNGGTVIVIGKSRNQWRLIQMYMPRNRLTNFRSKKVYDRRALEMMTRLDRGGLAIGNSPSTSRWWGNTDEDKEAILEAADYYNHDDWAHRQRL